MEKTNISREINEDRIMQLICLAEISLECCKIINKFLDKQRKYHSKLSFFNEDWVRYIMLSARNHFFESINIIHSLLHETNNKSKELSFQFYEEEFIYKDSTMDKIKTENYLSLINNIRNEFKNEKFNDIRNKIGDHKEREKIGDPLMQAFIVISNKKIEKLHKLIKDLKKVAVNFFKTKISCNNLLMSYKKGLKNLLYSFANSMSDNKNKR